MHVLKVLLTEGQPVSEIKVRPKIVDQSCVWLVEVNGTACVIRRDDAGSWMQQSSGNLSPESLCRVGQAIESLFDRPGSADL